MAKKNYINNSDFLLEIHKSKKTYCMSLSKEFGDYDLIVDHIDNVTHATIADAIKARVKAHNKGLDASEKISAEDVDPNTIIVRVLTFDHIPFDRDKAERYPDKLDEQVKIRCNFPPFKHYAIRGFTENSSEFYLVEVCRSHWKKNPKSTSIQRGKFSLDHGKMTDNLGKMFMKLAERIASRGNWRGYSFKEDMEGQAIMQLSQVGLQFNEYKSQNPFAYYTQTVKHSFTKILNTEKRNQAIRDDMLIAHGEAPSFTRQVENELEQRQG